MLVVPWLTSADPGIAEISHAVPRRAPHASLRDHGRTMDAKDLLDLIAREDDPNRRASYIHLLGGTGDDDAAARLEVRIDAAWQASDATDLAALLAADLELGGPERVARLEERHLLDTTRDLDEIEAALLALGMHGETDATVPRRDVVAAYRRLIRSRPPMAGFVAMDLAHCQDWSATGDFAALLNADAITDPASAFAALSYVHLSEDAAAVAGLEPPVE